MPAVFFGSISTLADTSELQRQAFNDAFSAYGLDWQWSREDYRSMLGSNGGAQRIADYAASHGQDVDAAAVHAKKSQVFRELLASSTVTPRSGVIDVIEEAKRGGKKLGLVTTTSKDNVRSEPALPARRSCATAGTAAARQSASAAIHAAPRITRGSSRVCCRGSSAGWRRRSRSPAPAPSRRAATRRARTGRRG